MKRSLSILLFSFSILTFGQASEVYRPQSAIDAAVEAVALKLELPSETIKNNYQINWEYIIVYEDDQPIVVQFSSFQTPSYCEVTLGSESLAITETRCN